MNILKPPKGVSHHIEVNYQVKLTTHSAALFDLLTQAAYVDHALSRLRVL